MSQECALVTTKQCLPGRTGFSLVVFVCHFDELFCLPVEENSFRLQVIIYNAY